jgi:hypothetical protein
VSSQLTSNQYYWHKIPIQHQWDVRYQTWSLVVMFRCWLDVARYTKNDINITRFGKLKTI